MKKTMLFFLIGAGHFSLQGSEQNASFAAARLEPLVGLVMDALIEKKGAYEKLENFVNTNRGLIDKKKDFILNQQAFGILTLRDGLQALDSRIFGAKEKIAQLVFPDFVMALQQPEKTTQEVVASYIELGLFAGMPFELIEFAYRKSPIDVDSNKWSISRDGEQVSLGGCIDWADERLIRCQDVILFATQRQNREVLELRNKIMVLVMEKRSNKPTSLDLLTRMNFIILIENCLIETKTIADLENFIGDNLKALVAGINEIRVGEARRSLGSYLYDKNSLLYPKNREIYDSLVKIGLRFEWQPVSIVNPSHAKGEVEQAIKKCLRSGSTQADLIKARHLYSRVSIDVDRVLFDESRTIGKALDTDDRLPFRNEIASLVSSVRVADPIELRKHVVAQLLDPKNDVLKKNVDRYLGEHAGTHRARLTLIFNGGFLMSFGSFVDGFNSILFPATAVGRQTHPDEKRDLTFLGTLWQLSIDNEELLPLVRTAHVNFIKSYKSEVDMYTFPYKNGQSIGEYLDAHPGLMHKKLFKKLSKIHPKKSSKSSRKRKKRESRDDAQVVQPSTLWKKLTIAAMVGIVGLVYYKYGQKTSKTATSNETNV